MAVDRIAVQRLLFCAARTRVGDYDVEAAAQRMVTETRAGLGVDGVALLTYQGGHLKTASASGAATWEAALMETATGDGPCTDSLRAAQVTVCDDLAVESRWPQFTRLAVSGGLRSLCAFPMITDDSPGGVVLAMRRSPGPLDNATLALGSLLADVACAYLQNAQEYRRVLQLSGHLQEALTSRVLIEQAKGSLATQVGITVDEAFERMRCQARASQRTLREVASEILKTLHPQK